MANHPPPGRNFCFYEVYVKQHGLTWQFFPLVHFLAGSCLKSASCRQIKQNQGRQKEKPWKQTCLQFEHFKRTPGGKGLTTLQLSAREGDALNPLTCGKWIQFGNRSYTDTGTWILPLWILLHRIVSFIVFLARDGLILSSTRTI